MSIILGSLTLYSCSETGDNDNILGLDASYTFVDDKATLTDKDKNALLFMLEEEKLARDTYNFLGEYWNIKQFTNIQKSEQTHMDAVASLLTFYEIPYEILPYGEFANSELQSLYDQFIVDGKNSEVAALTIGATIEDLDIVDLQIRMDATESANIINIFGKLQCGSENHLRAFTKGLGTYGETYSPQFLTVEAYENIINSSSGGCK